MSSSLRADIGSEKNLKIVEEFVLKLPANNTHQYHVIEGEVLFICVLFISLKTWY